MSVLCTSSQVGTACLLDVRTLTAAPVASLYSSSSRRRRRSHFSLFVCVPTCVSVCLVSRCQPPPPPPLLFIVAYYLLLLLLYISSSYWRHVTQKQADKILLRYTLMPLPGPMARYYSHVQAKHTDNHQLLKCCCCTAVHRAIIQSTATSSAARCSLPVREYSFNRH